MACGCATFALVSDEPSDKPPPADRLATGQFRPGVSGNPKGRPRVDLEFRARCRAVVDEKVFGRWVREILEDGPQWIAAAKALAEYGYGKPHQSTDVTVTTDSERPLAGVSAAELLEALRKIREGDG